jgi:5'-phosphate synthase pdxT subunit
VKGMGSVRAVFIRAPVISELGPAVEVLGEFGGQPVLVRQGKLMAAAFHPEIAGDQRLHERLLAMADEPRDRG